MWLFPWKPYKQNWKTLFLKVVFSVILIIWKISTWEVFNVLKLKDKAQKSINDILLLIWYNVVPKVINIEIGIILEIILT